MWISAKLALAIFFTLFYTITAGILKDKTETIELEYFQQDDGLDITIIKDNEIKLNGKLQVGKSFNHVTCIGEKNCEINDFGEELTIQPMENGFKINAIGPADAILTDCYDLDTINDTHWYGGPEIYKQEWPLEKLVLDDSKPYIISKGSSFGIAERYWLHSNGTYILVDDQVPLWIDQNNKYDGQVCFTAQVAPPYIRNFTLMSYFLGTADNAKLAHLNVVNNWFGKPTGHPNEKMISEPIWTTWAKYKKNINTGVVLEFAQSIRNHSYDGGQIEIDDNWERCYGSQEFDTDKFPNISETVATLKNDNFRVTLWIHPFVDDNCQNNSNVGKENDYFVKDINGNITASWWDSDDSHQIDFTNLVAAQWFTNRLKELQTNTGIDSFKFDAGETDYVNDSPVFSNENLQPNIITTNYSDTCAQFGDLIELRVAYRSQRHPHFVRMFDKDSRWGNDNGLAALIPTLLQLNMNGYGMVLPDIIGGNGYDAPPTSELFVRWAQATTFMPAMQFSYLPWEFNADFDVENIVKKYVNLHSEYSTKILAAMQQNIENGTPVNPPIWWIDPEDPIALGIDNEFLLGEDILVAPVITEGATARDIYLPKGRWQDGNDNATVYSGPSTLTNYNAPIDTLPWFILVSNTTEYSLNYE